MSRLDRRPDFTRGNHRYLCLQMNPRGGTSIVRICLGGKTRTYQVLGVSRTSDTGKVRSSKVIRAEVKRADELGLVATFDPRAAGLPRQLRVEDRRQFREMPTERPGSQADQ